MIDFPEAPTLRGLVLPAAHAATGLVAHGAPAVPPDKPWAENDLTGITLGRAPMILSGAPALAPGAGRWAFIEHVYPTSVGGVG
ncbi:hypothetical protein [Streptomyces roseolilacinus]|uniref:hypothetical protein n=1 Tax=Streptomyces roseolilacinus TaxID=66904 RepID=UPI0038014EF4